MSDKNSARYTFCYTVCSLLNFHILRSRELDESKRGLIKSIAEINKNIILWQRLVFWLLSTGVQATWIFIRNILWRILTMRRRDKSSHIQATRNFNISSAIFCLEALKIDCVKVNSLWFWLSLPLSDSHVSCETDFWVNYWVKCCWWNIFDCISVLKGCRNVFKEKILHFSAWAKNWNLRIVMIVDCKLWFRSLLHNF